MALKTKRKQICCWIVMDQINDGAVDTVRSIGEMQRPSQVFAVCRDSYRRGLESFTGACRFDRCLLETSSQMASQPRGETQVFEFDFLDDIPRNSGASMLPRSKLTALYNTGKGVCYPAQYLTGTGGRSQRNTLSASSQTSRSPKRVTHGTSNDSSAVQH